jgi:hypothetical protein
MAALLVHRGTSISFQFHQPNIFQFPANLSPGTLMGENTWDWLLLLSCLQLHSTWVTLVISDGNCSFSGCPNRTPVFAATAIWWLRGATARHTSGDGVMIFLGVHIPRIALPRPVATRHPLHALIPSPSTNVILSSWANKTNESPPSHCSSKLDSATYIQAKTKRITTRLHPPKVSVWDILRLGLVGQVTYFQHSPTTPR